jgi:TM2 domain-containing membrane protein YozV
MTTHSAFVGYVLWLFGFFGLHRFYFGKRTSGAIYAATLGLFGIGWLIDLLLIPSMKRAVQGRYQYGRYNYSVAWLLLGIPPLGLLGLHRFYVGRWATGLLYLCTAGVFGLGWLYDLLVFNNVLSETNEEWVSGEVPAKRRKVARGERLSTHS